MLWSQCGIRGNALGLKEDPISFPLQSDIGLEIASTSPWQAPPRPVMVWFRGACSRSVFVLTILLQLHFATVASRPDSGFSKLSWKPVFAGRRYLDLGGGWARAECSLEQLQIVHGHQLFFVRNRLETLCASTDSCGAQFVWKIEFRQVGHLKFTFLLLPILTL